MNANLQCRCIEWSPERGCCLKRNPLDVGHSRVESSNIYSVGYSETTLVLEVRFKDKTGAPSGLYRYLGVLPEHHQALVKAESVGKHLNTHIKGRHECHKVEEECLSPE